MPWTPKYPVGLTQVPKLMALAPFVSICHAEFSMFGRVKSGTINASQLFFQGSHVFSFCKLRITKIKSLHSTAGSENIWQLCCQNLFHTAITISKTNVGSSTKSSKKQIQWTLWDHVIRSAFYSFHLISFNPNFKRPIPSQKVDP